MTTSIFDAIEREVARDALRRDGALVDVVLRAKCADQTECAPVRGRALIDPGASHTAVEWSALDAVGAQPDGSFSAQGPTSGNVSLPTYPLRVEVDGLGPVDLPRVAATPHLRGQGIDALLGRDVLENSKFTYDGTSGTYKLEMLGGERGGRAAPSALPFVAAGVAAAVGAFAAWLFAPVCVGDAR